MRNTCSVNACGRDVKGRGLCGAHYARFKRTGTVGTDPVAPSGVIPQSIRFWAKVTKGGPDDCWIWTGALNEHGYGVMRPTGKRTGPSLKVHRYSAQLAGMDIAGRVVRHKVCDNPPCVNPTHLAVGTQGDNVTDCVSKGRTNRGVRNAHAKLTEVEVIEIRARYAAGGTLMRQLGDEYGVSQGTVQHVIAGTTWKHVTPPAARDLIAAVAASLGAA